VIAGLLSVSGVGCLWLWRADPHGVAALVASTLALAPLMTLLLLALGLAS
jgi:hypothetical protein